MKIAYYVVFLCFLSSHLFSQEKPAEPRPTPEAVTPKPESTPKPEEKPATPPASEPTTPEVAKPTAPVVPPISPETKPIEPPVPEKVEPQPVPVPVAKPKEPEKPKRYDLSVNTILLADDTTGLYASAGGGLVFSMNTVFSTAPMLAGVITYRRSQYLSISGEFQAATVKATNLVVAAVDKDNTSATITQTDKNSLGLIRGGLGFVFHYPWHDFEPFLGVGIYYQKLRTSSYSYSGSFAPGLSLGCYYNFGSRLSAGFESAIAFGSSSSITRADESFTLNESLSQTNLQIRALVRFKIFSL